MRFTACVVVFCALSSASAVAQNQAKTWEQKKTERFQPISDEHRAAISNAVADKPTARPKQQRRVLVFFRCEGFIHTSIPHGNLALGEMANKTGAFQIDLADSYDVFNAENLANYDCIVLNNSSGLHFPSPAQQNAFLDFISGGKGLVGIHGASDSFGRHPECRAIVGGLFKSHPWGAGGTWAFKLDDPDHVLNRAFDGRGFWHQDEIYQYSPDSFQGPEVLRLLVSLDMTKQAVSGQIDDGPREVPVSWIRKAGDGRVFYTNLGHREETFRNPVALQHMLDGIQYAIGDLEADDEPTATSPTTAPALAPEQP